MAFKLITEQGPALPSQPLGELLLLIAAALVIVTVVGCTVGPDYRPLAMKLPEHWNGIDQQMKVGGSDGTEAGLATVAIVR